MITTKLNRIRIKDRKWIIFLSVESSSLRKSKTIIIVTWKARAREILLQRDLINRQVSSLKSSIKIQAVVKTNQALRNPSAK